MPLSAKAVLQRVGEIEVRIDSTSRVVIGRGRRKVETGPHGLTVLAEFSQPRTIAQALDRLQRVVTGAEDWKDLTATIVRLHEAGILIDGTGEPPAPRDPPSGYGAAPIHVQMLNDRARSASFIAGIRAVVRPGDVVVEIGTGTGILSVAAARAGARHVYTIEATSIAETAVKVFAANGLSDQITLVRGWSTRVELPELGDVLVSEMIGNDPLAERLLELTADATKRLLKPDARLVPASVSLFGLPVTVPRSELRKHTFSAGNLERWRSWYDIDFSPLAAVGPRTPRAFFLNPHKARRWKTLSEAVPLAEVDLKSIGDHVFDRRSTATAAREGDLNGVLVYFEAELGPGVVLSTHPARVDAGNHWLSPVWVCPEVLSLDRGDRFEVRFKYRTVEGPNGVTVARPGE